MSWINPVPRSGLGLGWVSIKAEGGDGNESLKSNISVKPQLQPQPAASCSQAG